MTGSTQTRSRARHKSLESPVPGKRARRVRREAAQKRPASTWDTGPRCAAHPTGSNAPPRRAGRPLTGRSGTGVHGSTRKGGVRVMQTADALLEIIHERGKRGLPLERLYRHLFNPELYLRAYGKIYRNDGAMTPGVDAETVDGMNPFPVGGTRQMRRDKAVADLPGYRRAGAEERTIARLGRLGA